MTSADVVDGDRIALLKFVEPLYVYAAFCGFVLGGTTESDLLSAGHACRLGVESALAAIEAGEVDTVKQDNADALAQDLLVRLDGKPGGGCGCLGD